MLIPPPTNGLTAEQCHLGFLLIFTHWIKGVLVKISGFSVQHPPWTGGGLYKSHTSDVKSLVNFRKTANNSYN